MLAHGLNRKVGLVRKNQRIDVLSMPLSLLAKQAVAFAKISCSIVTCRTQALMLVSCNQTPWPAHWVYAQLEPTPLFVDEIRARTPLFYGSCLTSLTEQLSVRSKGVTPVVTIEGLLWRGSYFCSEALAGTDDRQVPGSAACCRLRALWFKVVAGL